MGELVFVGLGLYSERGMSLLGLEEAKKADEVFIELYTSLMPGLSLKHLEELVQKKLHLVSRKEIEEENGERILRTAVGHRVVLLVPGDPLVATTHVALRIEATKRGISTRIVHGASIFSAVAGLSGLHSYKFGKSVTTPFPDENPSETPYQVIAQNSKLGLHTLCLLDIKEEEKRYLTIREALSSLLKTEDKVKQGAITMNTLAVGIARAGSNEPKVKAGYIRELLDLDFGKPPHTIAFTGKLHFTEAEALIVLADAPSELREAVQ